MTDTTDPYANMTKAQMLEAKRTERNARNWKGIKVARSRGVSEATMAIEREALGYCIRQGHTLRAKGTQACRPDLQDALMGRLGENRVELPALVGVKDPVALYLDELLRDGGEWSLADLLAKVNDRRFAQHKDPYTETACSARIRDLRKAGRHIEQRGEAGGATYWMPRPDQPAPLGE